MGSWERSDERGFTKTYYKYDGDIHYISCSECYNVLYWNGNDRDAFKNPGHSQHCRHNPERSVAQRP